MNNVFLTGEVGVGKSTILQNVLKKIDISIGGYTTKRVYQEHYMRFMVNSLYDKSELYTIIEVNLKDNSKKVYRESFETGLIQILDKSFEHRDLIVIDELGNAENDIDLFTAKIFDLLDSDKIVFGVLKDADCKFLDDLRNRNDTTIIKITKENRDYIIEKVMTVLKEILNSSEINILK